MSIPLNHHFVSQVHLKNFFNDKEQKIYVYDKILDNHYYKKTTKSLFSEPKLNSKFHNGIVDHSSIEEELNYYFEKDFSKNTEVIQQFIIDKNYTESVNIALIYFAKYGIIGDMRTPRFKQEIDNAIKKGLTEITHNATEELKSQIEKMFSYEKEVKYSNTGSYTELAEKIFKKMGNLIFQILIPNNADDYFIIPDFTAGTAREKINEYFNPDIKEIAFISLPLHSKIYLRFYSEKLFKTTDIPSSIILYIPSSQVEEINKINLDYCQDKVACENEEYLKKICNNRVEFNLEYNKNSQKTD
ncbi:hypothetical protein BSF41_12630 [Flavobacterium sp. ACN2]|uniref:DUF4238 domain-containing protein n=1 Tax=Flavobacterium sp. ACN2 TaxID=1975676 RepID=UPI000BB33C39|nr:DUF4238 domain-containing protein [Flavobacterium sp. ACN2]PBI91660.1 hypothetical protein BSF41_12630 [Flavobacterium sp. ACN2]